MADKDMLDFLAGLQADGDTITLDGEPVCYVLGHTGRQVSTVEAAEWIVSACHRASRTCETCKHWSRVSDNDFGVCGFWTNDRSTWHAYDDERCRNWQDKEAADA